MPKETFTVYLNSATATNVTVNTSVRNMTYYIPWSQIIPDKYKTRKFLLSTAFQTNNVGTAAFAGYITADLGSNTVSTGNMRSNFISMYSARTSSASDQNYHSDPSQNFPVTVGYPITENVNIQFFRHDNLAGQGIYGTSYYMLILSFTLIDPDTHSDLNQNGQK